MTSGGLRSPAERKRLKARAHRLEPVVWIGGDGLTDGVIAEIERALAAHELIKVRAAGLGREARETAMTEICERCAAQPVQHIGKVLVLFRRKPEPDRKARDRESGVPASRSSNRARATRARRAVRRS